MNSAQTRKDICNEDDCIRQPTVQKVVVQSSDPDDANRARLAVLSAWEGYTTFPCCQSKQNWPIIGVCELMYMEQSSTPTHDL